MGDNHEPGRHDAAVAEIRRLIQADVDALRHCQKLDGIAADLIGTILLRLQSGEDPRSVHRAYLEAGLWLIAQGTQSDRDFFAAIMAFQTMVGVNASRGRIAALQGPNPP